MLLPVYKLITFLNVRIKKKRCTNITIISAFSIDISESTGVAPSTCLRFASALWATFEEKKKLQSLTNCENRKDANTEGKKRKKKAKAPLLENS